MSSFFLLALSASAALLGNAPVNTCREHPRASAIMQANRRSVLAAAACLALPTKAAWAGYALGAAAVAEHSTIATGKAKEKAVYDSVRSSIDAKRPDRPDLGTRAPAPYPQPYKPYSPTSPATATAEPRARATLSRCTVGYVGGEYTKESSRGRIEFEQQLALQESQKTGAYTRPEDLLGGAARMTVSPRAAQFR